MIVYLKENHTPTQNTYKHKPTEYIHYGILKLAEFWQDKISEVLKIKLLGLLMIMIGILGCIIFPEDATGGVFACGMGTLVVLFYNGIDEE